MAHLESGSYLPHSSRKVTVWPKPDANGNGETVWNDNYDSDGRSLGRDIARDNNGNEIKHYTPPEGFRNVVNSDRQDQWTKTNPDGSIYRNANGEAVVIRPGTALVEYPDGSFEILPDEYAQYVFSQTHHSYMPTPSEETVK